VANTRFNLQAPVEFTLSADSTTRTIVGLAMPAGAVAMLNGRNTTFDIAGLTFRDRTPILMGHDDARAVGRLTGHSAVADGLQVSMSIAKTVAGDEALELSQHGVLGMSVGGFIDEDSVTKKGDVYSVGKAEIFELSLTAVPVYEGTRIYSVTMSIPERSAMPDTPPVGTPPTTPPTVPTFTVEQFRAMFGGAVPPAEPPTPAPTVVPVAPIQVTEEPLYRFQGGIPGKFSFLRDIVASNVDKDSAAEQRLQQFIGEAYGNVRAAITTTTAPTLNPLKTRPELLVGLERFATRPLSAAISTGTISNADPFRWPVLVNEDPDIRDHQEGVEPSDSGSYTSGEASITPTGVDTKIKISRESLMSDSRPSLDSWVWTSINYGLAQKFERRIAVMLNAVPVTGTGAGRTASIAGSDDVVTDALNAVVIHNQYLENGAYESLVLNEAAYTALASGRDSTGRPLVVFGNSVNSDGTRSANFGNLYVSGLVGVPAYSLTTYAFLLRGSEIVQWTSNPLKFTFDQVEVSNVYLGVLALEAHTVMRNSAVIRLTR
jgi:HK97 family phage prohead protease